MPDFLTSLSWQDIVLGGGNLFLFIALIPSIVSPHKPALATGIMTASILSTFSIAFYTLELAFSMVTVTLSATAWWVLAFQRYGQIKRERTAPAVADTPDTEVISQ